MHIILTPVDGSVHSVKAIHISCDLCQKYGGRVVLCHTLLANKTAQGLLDLKIAAALESKILVALRNVAAMRSTKAIPEPLLKEIGHAILQLSAEQVRRRELEPIIMDIDTGDAAENILKAANSRKANTIVMGCRGITSSQPGHFGSVSQKVFAEAQCTCIAVK